MYGPLTLNPNPYSMDAGPLGKIYGSGIVSGLGVWQNHRSTGDHTSQLDLDNGQLFIQKTDGLVQFYVQAGGYSMPSLGTAYVRMDKATDDFYGPVPVAYVKITPTENFSVEAGKLYTLIGTENTFTFQNANIERGLLWNQTNAVNRGVQINYTQGPWNGSVALSDGFYSGRFDWLSGLVTYTIDPNNSITAIASGNISHDGKNTLATPLAQNNSQIYDLNYSYTVGAWNLSPTLQYTVVPKDPSIGLTASASSYDLGITTKYKLSDKWNIAARAEVIDTTGGTNIAYGPGSKAWSITFTPTWQQDLFFVRPEASYVKALSTTPGDAFGKNGNESTQARLLVEAGVLF